MLNHSVFPLKMFGGTSPTGDAHSGSKVGGGGVSKGPTIRPKATSDYIFESMTSGNSRAYARLGASKLFRSPV